MANGMASNVEIYRSRYFNNSSDDLALDKINASQIEKQD